MVSLRQAQNVMSVRGLRIIPILIASQVAGNRTEPPGTTHIIVLQPFPQGTLQARVTRLSSV